MPLAHLLTVLYFPLENLLSSDFIHLFIASISTLTCGSHKDKDFQLFYSTFVYSVGQRVPAYNKHSLSIVEWTHASIESTHSRLT